MWIYSSSDTARDDHRIRNLSSVKHEEEEEEEEEDDDDDLHSTTSSSIGNNSDASADDDDVSDGEDELQSCFKGSLNNLSDLEQALSLKKGISTFYSGKSKSYTSLADAVSAPSIQDIVKPEDAYNRKRKNMLAHTVILNKNRNFASKSVISKNVANANRENNHHHNAGGGSSSPGSSRPPLPGRHKISPIAINELPNPSPRNYCSPWRSLSLSDLQLAGRGGSSASSFKGNKRDEDD